MSQDKGTVSGRFKTKALHGRHTTGKGRCVAVYKEPARAGYLVKRLLLATLDFHEVSIVMTNGHDDKYSHWESNPDQRFRKPPFYPLNYESIGVRRGVFRPDKTCVLPRAGRLRQWAEAAAAAGRLCKDNVKNRFTETFESYYSTILLKCVNCFGSLAIETYLCTTYFNRRTRK